MGVLSRGCRVPPNIQRPLAAKLCIGFGPPKVFEVQEHARGPLSPSQVWWDSDVTRRRGGQKRGSFCLFVCLFVHHAFKLWGVRQAAQLL